MLPGANPFGLSTVRLVCGVWLEECFCSLVDMTKVCFMKPTRAENTGDLHV
jgi:hypothetical protein